MLVQLREWVDHVQVNDQQTKPQSLNIKISFHGNCLIKKPLDQNSWPFLLHFTFSHQRTFLHFTLKVSTSTPGQSAGQKRRSCLFHRRHFSSPCLILAAGCVTSALAALGARCPVRACTRTRARGQLRSRIRRSRRRRRAGRGLRRRRWKPAERAAQPVKLSSKSQSCLKVRNQLRPLPNLSNRSSPSESL